MTIRPRYVPNQHELLRLATGDMIRASGNCVCLACGELYYDHLRVEEPYEFLRRICDGRFVKL